MGDEQHELARFDGLAELLAENHARFTREYERLLAAQALLTETQQRSAMPWPGIDREIARMIEARKRRDEQMRALTELVEQAGRGPAPPAVSGV